MFADKEVEETHRLLRDYIKELKKNTKEKGNAGGDQEN